MCETNETDKPTVWLIDSFPRDEFIFSKVLWYIENNQELHPYFMVPIVSKPWQSDTWLYA